MRLKCKGQTTIEAMDLNTGLRIHKHHKNITNLTYIVSILVLSMQGINTYFALYLSTCYRCFQFASFGQPTLLTTLVLGQPLCCWKITFK